MKSSLVTALAALALGFLAVPAQATPTTGVVGDLRPIAGEGADVEQARHRCYRHRGHWHCPEHRYRRYYYEPGVRFHFGPRRHHHRHWRD
jgi:hypothetical protein